MLTFTSFLLRLVTLSQQENRGTAMVPRFFFCFQGVSAFHSPHNRFTYFVLMTLFSEQITHGITHGGCKEKRVYSPVVRFFSKNASILAATFLDFSDIVC